MIIYYPLTAQGDARLPVPSGGGLSRDRAGPTKASSSSSAAWENHIIFEKVRPLMDEIYRSSKSRNNVYLIMYAVRREMTYLVGVQK